jgi:phosphatidylglycerophosphate synthase
LSTTSPEHSLPPFRSLVKSKAVEDPINRHFNRRLAYAFVRVFRHTALTPNQITLLSFLVGVLAAVSWFVGTRTSMVVGGVLLWSSAILDGADGIMARAKNMRSQHGRALDGTADMGVAVATLTACVFHIWTTQSVPYLPLVALVAIVTSVLQIYLYDHYKEAYLAMTDLTRGAEGDSLESIQTRLAELRESRASWMERFVMQNYVVLLTLQDKVIRALNPGARLQARSTWIKSPAAADIYRAYNRGPMRLWTWVSLAPHMYLLSIFGMFDRLDLYLWVRVLLMNLMFFVALIWQRKATERTVQELAVPASSGRLRGNVEGSHAVF